ncbi:MAG: hypothetical protein KIH01_02095 [Candidatus Freyarchaeota archaeon]|nr:hypothetical protein [Candidatus Jordarchaeia archaeon]
MNSGSPLTRKVSLSKEKVYVVDSSAFIEGYPPHLIEEKQYVPAAIEEELRDQRSRSLLDAAVRSGDVIVMVPSDRGVKLAEEVAEKTGEAKVLSKVDKHVVALAFDLAAEGYEPVIVTDDYALQNVACKAGFTFKSLMRDGIRNVVKWKLYCSSCRRSYPPDYPDETCEVCGGQLKRVRYRRGKVHGVSH